MMNKKYLLGALLSVLAIYGCNDETSGTVGQPNEPAGNNCEECDSGKCTSSGECIEEADEGDDCDKTHVCKNDLKCKGGKCIKVEEPTDDPGRTDLSCETADDCLSGEACGADGLCVKIQQLGEDDECEDGDETKVCGEGLFCDAGVCSKEPVTDINISVECSSDADCKNVVDRTTCLSTGYCGRIGEVGELCSDEVECPEGTTCINTCVYMKDEGEECDESNDIYCNGSLGFECIEGACHRREFELPIGRACNDSYLKCATDLTCLDSECKRIVKTGDACDEKSLLCEEGHTCIGGTCAPTAGECASNSDCKYRDTYCCLSDECGAKNTCVQYEKNGYDQSCVFNTKPGIFEAQIQCRWQPPANDKYPQSAKVEMHPLVGPFGNNGKNNVVAVWSYNTRYSEYAKLDDTKHQSMIRFIDPETCNTLESIEIPLANAWYNYPAAADLDGDGFFEFVVMNNKRQPVAYKWDAGKKKHVVMWTGKTDKGGVIHIFDVDGDKNPEVLLGDIVINGKTGETIFGGIQNKDGVTSNYTSQTAAYGYLDLNKSGTAMMAISKGLYRWDKTAKKWVNVASFPASRAHYAYADFGTPGDTAAKFSFAKLDGKPEIVASGNGVLNLYALVDKGDGKYDVQQLMTVNYLTPIHSTTDKVYGGPITVGDFDSDGLPEIGVATSGFFGVYDPRCAKYEKGVCAAKNVLWERWSQDASSGQTGSSLFDFDGDGQTEAVYADECFTRVYDGKTGKVLFSAKRSSSTSVEAPVIVDVDNDGSAEILMGSDSNMSCYDDSKEKVSPSKKDTDRADPIHEGIPCTENADCPTKKCNKTIGLCTCTETAQCNTLKIDGKDIIQYVCTEPIHPQIGMMIDKDNTGNRTMVKDLGTRPDGYKNDYKVCRATRQSLDFGISDMMIFKDRLDRWVSSRTIWNQHNYNIINIQNDGKVPTIADWIANWSKQGTDTISGSKQKRPLYNNYRLNEQGKYGAGMAPDITGHFIEDSICGKNKDGKYVISGELCNRGTKPVATKLPATFFYYDESKTNHRGKTICTSYTKTIVGVGECSLVGCEVSEEELQNLAGQKVLMVTNLDQSGNASTIECNTDNNTDEIVIDNCTHEIDVN